MVKLEIDGVPVEARDGETILSVAERHGIDIPHLCHDDRLKPAGACRMCLVEIRGQRGLQTACTRTAERGMVVRTKTDWIVALRKTVLEMLLSEHRVACTTCDKDGECLLQDYAYEYQVDEKAFPNIASDQRQATYTDGDESIVYDPSKCIRCGRCVRICAEVQRAEAITFRLRGGKADVTTGFGVPLVDSTCVTCGQCVSTCPTGALYEKKSIGKGQVKDLEKVRTTCPYCGVGCQIDLNINRKTGRIARTSSEIGVVPNRGNLCVKGRFGCDFVEHPDRLTTPLLRRNGDLEPCSWDEALDFTAKRLMELKEEHGADAIGGLSSAKTTNEENYIMQKFMRAAIGTNNVDHCARLCHASTVAGLARAFGSGAMTNSIDDITQADAVFVIGSNTTECHPVIGAAVMKAVAEQGLPLIVADPRRIELADRAVLHLQQRNGTDVALINAMIHVILEEGLEDKAFIEKRTEDFEELRDAVQPYTPKLASTITGVPAEDIVKAARLYASAGSAAIIYSMGITQHTTGTDNVLSLANLAMVTGNIGKPGAGVNPLRGQNNVQGACDLGALPNVYPGYQKVDDEDVQRKFEKAWGVPLSLKVGLTVVEMMNAACEGDLKALYVLGENPMLSDPDVNHVEQGLKTLDLLIVQDIFLTETAKLADVVFPATSFAEKDGCFTNTERRVQRVRKAIDAPGEARVDWEITCELARRIGYEMSYADASEIQDEIARLSPIYGGITYDRLDGVGLQWPCPVPDHPGTPYLHRERFSRGLGKFHPVEFIDAKELPDDEYPFIFSTGRMLQHFHTGSMSRRSGVLDWLVPEGLVEMHPDDAAALGVAGGGKVRVASRRGEIEIGVQVTDRVAPGSVFLAFHFREAAANRLTIAELDPIAKIPELKVCAVKIEAL
jgi:formate dehydrogenase alpha subunit